VEALGLRPLWVGATEKEYFFSSEKGVYHLDTMHIDPVPLSPGEKMRIRVRRGQAVEVLDYPAIQQRILKLTLRRFGSLETMNSASADLLSRFKNRSSYFSEGPSTISIPRHRSAWTTACPLLRGRNDRQ
jgi:hypothetical protein